MEKSGFEQDRGNTGEAGLRAALEDAERRADSSQKRLEEIQSLAKVGSWEWELTSERATWSEELRRIAGLNPDEPVPTYEEFVESIHPDDRDGFLATVGKAFEEGGVRRHSYRAVLPDGSEKTIETHARVETDASGNPLRVFGAAQDVTDRLRTGAELARRAEEQATIAALSREAMSSDDIDRLMREAARAVVEILGVELADIFELKADGVGLDLRASVGREEAESVDDEDAQAVYTLAASEPVLVENYSREERFIPSPWQAAAKSGATVVIEGGDQAYGVLGAYTAGDHPFSVDSIQFLQAVAHVLAAAIARRRAQRLESQLHQNQRLEAVGQLAGGVAHDFNNLLVVILNYAEFLLDRVEDKELREDIGEIKTAADRAAALTHQLLVFSRREVVVPETVDLNEVVVETEGLLRKTLQEHIELVHSFAEGLWMVRLGSGQAEQILVNLLVNARNAMPEGGTVDVKTENLELGSGHNKEASLTDGQYVRLTVADTGTGMGEDVAAQAFDPFFTTRKDDGGTGLGLATVYGIVKEAGGHIEVYTEPGHGTAFKVYLPAIVDETATLAASEARQAVAASGQTILLVEDEENVRKLAKRILTENGYEILTAVDGQGALDLAAKHEGPIDLLLTDVVMPRLSGPQLARQLKELRPQLQALYMSGYTGEVISRHGIVEEGVALIEKPFDAKGLLYAVSNALHGEMGEG